MKSVDDVVAELRIKVAKNLARDVCIVSIDCDDALALSQMAADFSVMLAEGRRAISAIQREADGMREALEEIVSRYEAKSDMTDDEGIAWHARARAALNGPPQERG